MEDKLRQDYALGQEAEAAEVSTRQFAESRGLSVHTVHKLRAFARGYSGAELEQLCKLRRPNGLPLHWGYVGYLLTVKPATIAVKKDRRKPAKKSRNKERWEFAKRAAKKGWTAPQLYAAIRQEYGWKQRHGRPMLLPNDMETAVRQVMREGQAYCKRLKLLKDKQADLPARKQRSLKREFLALLLEVSAAVQDVLNQLRSRPSRGKNRSTLS